MTRVFSGSSDGTVRVWDAKTADCVNDFRRARARRPAFAFFHPCSASKSFSTFRNILFGTFRNILFGTLRHIFSAGLCPVKSQRCPSAASYPPRSRTFWVLVTPSLSPRARTPYSAFRSRASSKKRACARAAAAHPPASDRVFLLLCCSCSMLRRICLSCNSFSVL